ncbi:hypothetical protein GCM10018781_19880 [Kitasatospora indigofera]|uniref:Uncharacterized protein n=1 Tax=Kitasatospora indigofera TaxID=67307 RepID=A0A919KNM7_9ACTN|nr:hypothetical protein GCM10018781_19880 [Kitasatospora indigofera]
MIRELRRAWLSGMGRASSSVGRGTAPERGAAGPLGRRGPAPLRGTAVTPRLRDGAGRWRGGGTPRGLAACTFFAERRAGSKMPGYYGR